ncbi:MAG: MFS transporter [Phyllobacteriaceae bacterium]|nr:MFS transporter [Phyllobacteriaceae bacterium]
MPSDTSSAMPYSGRRAGALTFSILFTMESLVRSLNAGVISVQAYELLGSSRNVSIIMTMSALAVLVTTLMLPFLLRRMRRRWTYTIGIAVSIGAALFLASHTVAGQALGTYLRSAGASVMNVTLSLYILDHIHKSDYARVEPMRLTFSTISWTIGPSLGLWLYANHGPVAAQLAVLVAGLSLLTFFWIIRLADPAALPSGTLQPFNPLKNVGRFMAQPRLRLAWSIACARSVYWSALFIYGPIMLIESGMSKSQSGYVISASQLILPLALVSGLVARRVGVRKVIASAFALICVSSVLAGLFGSNVPIVSSIFLLIGAMGATALDGVGAIPYMRAVRPRERREMTSVYRTFIEVSDLLPGIIFAFVLTIFPTQAVYVLVGGLALAMAFITWKHLPKSL